MRVPILTCALILLPACATPPAVTEGEVKSAESSPAAENARVPASAIPYQVKVTLGELIRYDSSRDPGSRVESPPSDTSPTGRSPSLVSAIRKMIEGVTEFYKPVRTKDEHGTPVLEDTERSLAQSKVVELWLKGRSTPWREGEIVENYGWRLKLLSVSRSSGGSVFEIEVLQEGE